MHEFTIEEFITPNVVYVHPEIQLNNVISKMQAENLSCIIIVEHKKPIGIFTERDVVHLLSGLHEDAELLNLPIHKLMTSPIHKADKSLPLTEAIVFTQKHRIRHLPIVNIKDELLGLVTQTNLVEVYFKVITKQKEVLENLVNKRTQQLQEANQHLKNLSLIDGLLEIGNRRAMETELEQVHATSLRYKKPYAIILFDVDYFKAYNDYYGHPAGDAILKKIATTLKSGLRKTDSIFRYGGEEILVLLNETSLQGAHELAIRLLNKLVSLAIAHCKSPLQILTVSGGLACEKTGDEYKKSWKEVVSEADNQLYRAKHNGRNQIASAVH